MRALLNLFKNPVLLIFGLIFSANTLLNAGGDPQKKIAIVGDLQTTSTLEFLMAREDNDAEREHIIHSIAAEEPGIVVLLGDMIYDGSDKSQWSDFKKLIKPIKRKKIPIYPVLGNHEYWGSNSSARQNVSEIFPLFKKSPWYSVVFDSLALIFLDSNSLEYPTKDWDMQRHWFEKTIKEYDEDPNILGIFIFLHHPPYTNSIVTGDEIAIQQAFVPAFTKSKKGLILFAGHAHTYEKFYIKDKYYIVSGGGGGPRVLVKTGREYHHDLCTVPSPRPFHYITMERNNNGIRFIVHAIDKGTSRFYKMEDFTLNFHY